MSNGFLAHTGPSKIDGAPTIAIVTWNSRNPKTGDMNQLWVMRADLDPWEALNQGKDTSVCGTCPLASGRGCYVQVPQAPLSIWRGYQRDIYPRSDGGQLAARPLRMAAYGDPAALPRGVIELLVAASPGWTGFTHQWRERRFQWLKDFCMASVQSLAEEVRATQKGWRCFRVKAHDDPVTVPVLERVCPASDEGGHKLTCVQCGYCSGLQGKGVGSVVINVHGTVATQRRALESIG